MNYGVMSGALKYTCPPTFCKTGEGLTGFVLLQKGVIGYTLPVLMIAS